MTVSSAVEKLCGGEDVAGAAMAPDDDASADEMMRDPEGRGGEAPAEETGGPCHFSRSLMVAVFFVQNVVVFTSMHECFILG